MTNEKKEPVLVGSLSEGVEVDRLMEQVAKKIISGYAKQPYTISEILLIVREVLEREL